MPKSQTKKETKLKTTKKIGQPLISYFLTALIIFFLACMISQPAKFISKSLDGISAWAFNVLPSVLPFMFFTRLLSSLNTMPQLTRPFSSFTQKLFKTPPISFYALVMAILSGYPVGSKMVADLFMQGQISKQDAFRMTSFCSTSGPMFIVGAVGIGMFGSAKIGYILFVSHVIGAILNGIIYRNLKVKESREEDFIQTPQKSFDLSEIVLNSALSILSVGCIITIFFIVIECLSPILSLLPQNISYFLEGIIEITKGCLDLATLPNKFWAVTLCSLVISFGGISTLLQSITMISKIKMPVKLFALQKITHALLSFVATLLVIFLFGI